MNTVLKIDSLNTLSGTNTSQRREGSGVIDSLVPDGQLREKHTHLVSCPPCESTDQHIRAFLRLTKTEAASPAEEESARQGFRHISHQRSERVAKQECKVP